MSAISARVPSELLPELPVRPRTVDPSRPTRSYYSRGQQPSTITPHYASLQSKELLQRRPQTTEGLLGQQPWLVQPQLQPQHLAPPRSAGADRSAGSGRWSTSGADGASWHGEMSNGALFSIAASLSASASFTAAWTANDTIASELGTPQISVPRNVPPKALISVMLRGLFMESCGRPKSNYGSPPKENPIRCKCTRRARTSVGACLFDPTFEICTFAGVLFLVGFAQILENTERRKYV